MIEPHVEHGGASSWFWIAANEEADLKVCATEPGWEPAAGG